SSPSRACGRRAATPAARRGVRGTAGSPRRRGRRGLAKVAGVSPEGTGSHRLAIASSAGPFTDPDAFEWTTADVNAER
ncbi:hypothetical protein ACWEGM_22120, partial [Streptomyces nigra]